MTADLHLGSLLTSAAGGIWQQDTFRSVRNVMIETKAAPPGTPPQDAVEVRKNVSFAEYIKAVDAVRDVQLDAPAPDRQSGGAMLGGPARVLRFKAPRVEVVLSYKLDPSTPGSLQLRGKIQEFNPGTSVEVLAINDDENQAMPLNRFQSAIVMIALQARMRRQDIDINLDRLQVPGFAIQSVSPLDPSGWVRINLVRTAGTPLRQTLFAQDVPSGATGSR